MTSRGHALVSGGQTSGVLRNSRKGSKGQAEWRPAEERVLEEIREEVASPGPASPPSASGRPQRPRLGCPLSMHRNPARQGRASPPGWLRREAQGAVASLLSWRRTLPNPGSVMPCSRVITRLPGPHPFGPDRHGNSSLVTFRGPCRTKPLQGGLRCMQLEGQGRQHEGAPLSNEMERIGRETPRGP